MQKGSVEGTQVTLKGSGEVRPGACFTSFSVSEYSFSLSTATMLVSNSDDMRTSQFKYVVTCAPKSHKEFLWLAGAALS